MCKQKTRGYELTTWRQESDRPWKGSRLGMGSEMGTLGSFSLRCADMAHRLGETGMAPELGHISRYLVIVEDLQHTRTEESTQDCEL